MKARRITKRSYITSLIEKEIKDRIQTCESKITNLQSEIKLIEEEKVLTHLAWKSAPAPADNIIERSNLITRYMKECESLDKRIKACNELISNLKTQITLLQTESEINQYDFSNLDDELELTKPLSHLVQLEGYHISNRTVNMLVGCGLKTVADVVPFRHTLYDYVDRLYIVDMCTAMELHEIQKYIIKLINE